MNIGPQHLNNIGSSDVTPRRKIRSVGIQAPSALSRTALDSRLYPLVVGAGGAYYGGLKLDQTKRLKNLETQERLSEEGGVRADARQADPEESS